MARRAVRRHVERGARSPTTGAEDVVKWAARRDALQHEQSPLDPLTMPICAKRKLAFIHIPKTAGSITKLLDMGEQENFFEVNYHAYEFDGVSFAPT